jgi:hypothetical protein
MLKYYEASKHTKKHYQKRFLYQKKPTSLRLHILQATHPEKTLKPNFHPHPSPTKLRSKAGATPSTPSQGSQDLFAKDLKTPSRDAQKSRRPILDKSLVNLGGKHYQIFRIFSSSRFPI